jgi:RNA polymerase sigma-32 factor
VRRRKSIGRQEELELVRAWQQDEDGDARERLVAIHTPRVEAIASRYGRNAVAREDLRAEAMLGFLVGLERFDPDREVRLMTYASHWVRAYVVDALLKAWARGKTGTGVARSRLFFKLRRQRTRHANLHRGQDLVDRLAGEIGTSTESIEDMLGQVDHPDVSLEAMDASSGPRDVVSREPDGGEGADVALEQVEQMAALRRRLAHALAALDSRERSIVSRRYLAPEPETLASIGRKEGISRERVRQIEQALLERMRRIMQRRGAPLTDGASLLGGAQ